MSFTYTLYLLFALAGTFALMRAFAISFTPKQMKAISFSLLATVIVFTAWDAWAVLQGHWSFGTQHMMNIFIGNQPLEEIGFFLVVPFFGIAVWRIVEKYTKTSVKTK